MSLLHEIMGPNGQADPERLAAIHALPLRLGGARPVARAIGTGDGVAFCGLYAAC